MNAASVPFNSLGSRCDICMPVQLTNPCCLMNCPQNSIEQFHPLSRFPWQWWDLDNNYSCWNSHSLFLQFKYVAQQLLVVHVQNWGQSKTHTFHLFVYLLLHACNLPFPGDELLTMKVCHFSSCSQAKITAFNVSLNLSLCSHTC